eukprot:6470146-Amphidinium_carterae.1
MTQAMSMPFSKLPPHMSSTNAHGSLQKLMRLFIRSQAFVIQEGNVAALHPPSSSMPSHMVFVDFVAAPP